MSNALVQRTTKDLNTLLNDTRVAISTVVIDTLTPAVANNTDGTATQPQGQPAGNTLVPAWDEILQRNQNLGEIPGTEDAVSEEIMHILIEPPNTKLLSVQKKRMIHDAFVIEHPRWIVRGINISEQLTNARLSCLDIDCKQMSDTPLP